MTSVPIIKENISRLTAAQDQAAKALATVSEDGSAFDLAKTIPNTEKRGLDVDGLVRFIVQSIAELLNKDDFSLVSQAHLQSIDEYLSSTAIEYDTITNSITSGLPLLSINSSLYKFTNSNGESTVGPHLATIANRTEKILPTWHMLRISVSTPEVSDSTSLLRPIADRRQEIEETTKELQRLRKDAQSNSKAIEAIRQQATEAAQQLTTEVAAEKIEVERIKGLVDSERRTISEILAEATTKIEGIRAASTSGSKLSETVSEYQGEFDRFQTQLEDRTKRFNEGAQELTQLVDRLKSEEETIVRLIKQAEGMLVGATNSGLAASMSARLGQMTREVSGARWAYYVAITFLVASTLPIAFYVLPRELTIPLIKAIAGSYVDPNIIIGKEPSAGPSDAIGHILARALLLIPGYLLVRFAGSRHERLFRLREHYAYKYSIASSVEGFKQQSPPEYRDYIALIAFHELTLNPATQMESSSIESRHPNPLMEKILTKFGLTPEK